MKKVYVLIPESEEEIALGVEQFKEGLMAVHRLIKSIEASLSEVAERYVPVGSVLKIKANGVEFSIIGNKSGVSLYNPKREQRWANCKFHDRLENVEHFSNIWSALQDPSFVQDVMIALNKTI